MNPDGPTIKVLNGCQPLPQAPETIARAYEAAALNQPRNADSKPGRPITAPGMGDEALARSRAEEARAEAAMEAMQNRAFVKFMDHIEGYMHGGRDELDLFDPRGQQIVGIFDPSEPITITPVGLMAAGHRWGADGTRAYMEHLEKNGWRLGSRSPSPAQRPWRRPAAARRIRVPRITAPPKKVSRAGTSAKTSHTQSGPITASSKVMRVASGAGM